MYSDHVPAIASGMRADPDTFIRGIMFAVLSIQQPVTAVPRQLSELARGDGEKWLFGSKYDAHEYLQNHGAALWAKVCAIPCDSPDNAALAIATLAQVPGLGIVKAAFVAQFLAFDVACLDTRNVRREKLNPRRYRTDGKKSGAAFDAKVQRYVCETYGRAQELWDRWCAEAADWFEKTPEEISAIHLEVIA